MVWALLKFAGKLVSWLTESRSVSVSWPRASEMQEFIYSEAGNAEQKELNKGEAQ